MARNTAKGERRLDERRAQFDALSSQARAGRTRPGSMNAHKGLTKRSGRR